MGADDWRGWCEKALNRFRHDVRELDVVMIDELLQNIAAVERVLTQPAGSLLAAGRAGYGRRSAVGLVANMHQMQVFSPKITKDYGLKQFKLDLKQVRLRRGIE